jgi:hypothetical protein
VLGIALVIGIYALLFGASLIGAGLRLRRLAQAAGPLGGDGGRPAA